MPRPGTAAAGEGEGEEDRRVEGRTRSPRRRRAAATRRGRAAARRCRCRGAGGEEGRARGDRRCAASRNRPTARPPARSPHRRRGARRAGPKRRFDRSVTRKAKRIGEGAPGQIVAKPAEGDTDTGPGCSTRARRAHRGDGDERNRAVGSTPGGGGVHGGLRALDRDASPFGAHPERHKRGEAGSASSPGRRLRDGATAAPQTSGRRGAASSRSRA